MVAKQFPRAIALLGPTASGKSRLALAIAKHFPVEIISVDSAQVFRNMHVGTAKPTQAEREAVAHHLIDIIDPTESYSAARFRTDALRLMTEIHGRHRLPLLVGGTMLYIKALREGLSPLPGANASVRAAIDEEALRHGWPAVHAELARIDPHTAARLSPSDSQRIQRALEVFRISGEPMSAHFMQRAPDAPALDIDVLALVPSDRSLLHQRIAQRFDAMLNAGLVEEVRHLKEKYPLHSALPSMRAVGYRQAWEFLDGTIDRTTLREKGIAATRQLAKRQLTWLRSMANVTTLDCLAPALEETALRLVREHWSTPS